MVTVLANVFVLENLNATQRRASRNTLVRSGNYTISLFCLVTPPHILRPPTPPYRQAFARQMHHLRHRDPKNLGSHSKLLLCCVLLSIRRLPLLPGPRNLLAIVSIDRKFHWQPPSRHGSSTRRQLQHTPIPIMNTMGTAQPARKLLRSCPAPLFSRPTTPFRIKS